MASTIAARATKIKDAETGAWMEATDELRRVGSGYEIRTDCGGRKSIQWSGVDYREAVRTFSLMAGSTAAGDATARRRGGL